MGVIKDYVRMRQVFLNGQIVEMTDAYYRMLQSIMFNSIWNERKHQCDVSDTALTVEARTYYFHHILEKRAYEKYALCKWNIIILSYEVHTAYENKSDTVSELVTLRELLLHKLNTGYEYDNESIWKGNCGTNHINAVMGREITQ